MKKTVLFIFAVILIGNAEPAMAQSSVDDAQKFAERCLKKVRNRRFRKLQESYPQAIKDIERIKANASEKEFGWDDIAKYAPDWIEMMETFEKFPNHQVKNKGEVIKFEITDYKPMLERAKDSAAKEHYMAGVKIMDENDNYRERRDAFHHFNKSMDYSDEYKEDIYQRAATIHYDEGLRIYNSEESFKGKKRAEESFKKALAWIKPFKDINELMAELYYAEAVRKFENLKPEEELVEILLRNESVWDEIEEIVKTSLSYLEESAEWTPEYKDMGEKAKEFRTKAASLYYTVANQKMETLAPEDELAENLFSDESAWDEVEKAINTSLTYLEKSEKWMPGYKDTGEKAVEFRAKAAGSLYKAAQLHQAVHEFTNQHKAANYYRKTSDWVPGYKDAENLAQAAEERMSIDVLFYSQGSFINPSKVGFRSSWRIQDPYDEKWGLLSVNPVENPEYAVSEVGRPFIAVVETEKGQYKYDKSETREQEDFTVYIARKKEDDGSITESESSKASYDLYNMSKDKVKNIMWVKKYTGTANYVYPEAKASVTNTISIWDLRDPENPVLVDQVNSSFEVSDKTSYMEYDGSSRAKPEFTNRYGDLKSKDALISELHGKAHNIENVYKNVADDIRESILKNVKYIHF